jgi:hypothetical protein
MEVSEGEIGELSEDPMAVDNPQNRAVLTMAGASVQALFAPAADHVDLPHHAVTNLHLLPLTPVPYPGGREGERNDLPHEFMSKDASVGIIAFDQFQVRAANARFTDFDQRFVRFARSWGVAQ